MRSRALAYAALPLALTIARAQAAPVRIVEVIDCPAGLKFVEDANGSSNFGVTFRDSEKSVTVHFQNGLARPVLITDESNQVHIVSIGDAGRDSLLQSLTLGREIHVEVDEDLSGSRPALAFLRWDVTDKMCPKQ